MRAFIRNILLIINISFAAALVISYMSAHISPAVFVLPAFFGLAFPYLMLVNIGFIALWIWRLKPEFLISTLVIIIGFHHLQNSIKLSGSKAETDESSYAVISYNLRLFNLLEGKKVESTEQKILDILKQEGASVICLQEYYVYGAPELKSADLKKQFGKGTAIHSKFIRGRENRNYGNLILSRYPVVKRGEVVFPNSPSLAIFADIKIKGDTIRFYNIHLQSFRLRRIEQSFIEEISSVDQKQLYSEVTNLYRSLRRGFMRRAEESRILSNHISTSIHPVILAGDFNDTPVSYTYHKLREKLDDSWVKSGFGLGYTYRGKYPPNRIDYIMHSPSIENLGFSIIREKHSDHFPIKATFSFSE